MRLVSRAGQDGAKYFGPFGGRSQTREIITTVSRALLLPDCSRKFPRDIGKERPCLNYHMGACAGWCLKDSDAKDYRRRMEQAALILDGRSRELIGQLKESMEQAAEELRFARGAKSCFAVLHFVDGNLVGKDAEMMDEPIEDDGEALSGLVRQYYGAHRGGWPRSILLPTEPEDAQELEALLSEYAGRRVYIETPRRGERMRLIESAQLNAREEILRRTTQAQRRSKTLE